MTMDQLVTYGEAAQRLGVSPPTLRKRIRRGEVETFRDPMNDRIKLGRVCKTLSSSACDPNSARFRFWKRPNND